MTSTPSAEPARTAPAPVPRPPAGLPSTHQASTDLAVEPVVELEQLATLDQRALGEHVEVFDAVHRALADRLRAAES